MNMLSDRNLQVMINGKESRSRIVNNGLPQGSVLSSILYCLYTSDLPLNTRSRLFIYADDITLAFQATTFGELEAALQQDLIILSNYFKLWRLKPNVGKTVHFIFHLNNHQANQKLNLQMDGDIVEHEPRPMYLGVTLDRSLTYRDHIEKTTKKLQSRINVVRKLAGTKWECRPKTLRITTIALVISTASYSAPVWMSSAHTHKIDVEINKALRSS